MKRHAMAVLATCIVSTGAVAQSNVSIYGVADAGIVRETGGPNGDLTKITSGVGSGSRLGFRGREDLGDGVAAVFLLENGVNFDTGTAGQGGLLFGRQAFVGLSSTTWGTVTLGRQYSPLYVTLRDIVDPFEIGMAGNVLNIVPGFTRVDNSVQYASVRYDGFSADVQYGAGETAGSTANNRQLGGTVRYAAGSLILALSTHAKNNTLATDTSRYTLGVAKYVFGNYSVDLARGRGNGPAGARINDTVLGATARHGASTLLASIILHDDGTRANRDARQWALAYVYSLSKRTDLYATHGHITNRNSAAFTVGNGTESGTGNGASAVGIRHRF
jgi:predicted porin